jgi:hypothetical protein
MAHRLDQVSANAHASPNAFQSFPSFQSMQVAPAPAPPAPPRWDAYHLPPQAHLRAGVGRPLVAPEEPTSRAELERYIAHCIPFLQEYDASSLIIRDLRYPPTTASPQLARTTVVYIGLTTRACRACRDNDDVWRRSMAAQPALPDHGNTRGRDDGRPGHARHRVRVTLLLPTPRLRHGTPLPAYLPTFCISPLRRTDSPSTWGDSMSWTAFSCLLWVRRRLRL